MRLSPLLVLVLAAMIACGKSASDDKDDEDTVAQTLKTIPDNQARLIVENLGVTVKHGVCFPMYWNRVPGGTTNTNEIGVSPVADLKFDFEPVTDVEEFVLYADGACAEKGSSATMVVGSSSAVIYGKYGKASDEDSSTTFEVKSTVNGVEQDAIGVDVDDESHGEQLIADVTMRQANLAGPQWIIPLAFGTCSRLPYLLMGNKWLMAAPSDINFEFAIAGEAKIFTDSTCKTPVTGTVMLSAGLSEVSIFVKHEGFDTSVLSTSVSGTDVPALEIPDYKLEVAEWQHD